MDVDVDRIRAVVEQSSEARANVRRLAAARRYAAAEPDNTRYALYTTRRAAITLPKSGREAKQGETLDLQPAWFLPEGAKARRAVAYVEVNTPQVSNLASGFLVSPRLFMTNQHVIADAQVARYAQVTFDREQGDDGRPASSTSFLLDPDAFALFSGEEELDYALVGIGQRRTGEAELDELGYCVLSNRPDKHVLGMNVNIVHHPNGLPKMVSIRNNLLSHRTARTLLYETDTETGSSGSPVFNDDWELVALHHWGEPFLETTSDIGDRIPMAVNEGVRISRIFEDLLERLDSLDAPQRDVLREALSYSDDVSTPAAGKRLKPKGEAAAKQDPEAPKVGKPRAPVERQLQTPQTQTTGREMKVTLPIEITISIGDPAGAGQGSAEAVPSRPVRALSSGAEKVKIDRDYTNRTGYQEDFVPGVVIPLPRPSDTLAEQIAPLRDDQPNAADGELLYEHFSIKLLKGKRVAAFTATNIDGANYRDVDRKTGLVKGPEAETWYNDDRVSSSFYLGQAFYSEWSTYFDRGHLTRRMDPNWGTDEEAERANADTYHFPNCSPQHFRFNQTTPYWQGAERYILEHGALAKQSINRLSVFTGPVYDDDIDLWADDVQIPSTFFKVIVWRGKKGLRSVALMVDQLALLGESRVNLGQPTEGPPPDVQQWRVPVTKAEDATGLDFGSDVRTADTFKEGPQPTAGEARVLIRSFETLLP